MKVKDRFVFRPKGLNNYISILNYNTHAKNVYYLFCLGRSNSFQIKVYDNENKFGGGLKNI